MKKIQLVLLLMFSVFSASAGTKFSAYKGVWSSDKAEAVVTDSICIFYCQVDSTMEAFLEIPSAGIVSKTVFAKDGKVTTTSGNKPLELVKTDGGISICGQTLKKVEKITTVNPYELAKCTSKFEVGKCLQQWRLGAGYGLADDMIYCEINTNRHMFVYMVSPSMVYIRAAAARNNNHGTLFFQNIRMMKNNNTGEYTMHMQPGNYRFTLGDIEIDNSKFRPDGCTYNPDGAIYWSLISFDPELIQLNGCGETYRVQWHGIEPEMEYFEYVPY